MKHGEHVCPLFAYPTHQTHFPNRFPRNELPTNKLYYTPSINIVHRGSRSFCSLRIPGTPCSDGGRISISCDSCRSGDSVENKYFVCGDACERFDSPGFFPGASFASKNAPQLDACLPFSTAFPLDRVSKRLLSRRAESTVALGPRNWPQLRHIESSAWIGPAGGNR